MPEVDSAGRPTGRTVPRPLLKARLRGPHGEYRLWMLVDSGSDETQVPISVWRRIGIAPGDEEVELTGMGGGKVSARVARVEMEVAGAKYVSRVVASDDFEDQFSLLGFRDFFVKFWVSFNGRKRFFDVNPSRD